MIPGTGVILSSETRTTLLEDKRLAALLPLLDGCLSLEEIEAAAAPALKAETTRSLVGQLISKGYVWDAQEEGGRANDAFWSEFGLRTRDVRKRLEAWRIGIESLGSCDPPALEDLTGDHSELLHGDRVFQMIFTDSYLRPELEEINREALKEGTPWMLAKTCGRELWIGPIFVPGRTGCWECLASRLRLNRQVETFLTTHAIAGCKESARDRKVSHPLGLALAGHALVKWLVAGRSEVQGAVVVYDAALGVQKRHVLVRRPQCKVCGDRWMVARRAYEPVALPSEANAEPQPSAEELYRRLEHHVSPVTGIVKEILRIPVDNAPNFHLHYALHSQAHRYASFDALRKATREAAGGQGTTEAASKLSALAEAIEVYLTDRQGDEPIFTATRKDLGDLAISPESITLFSERQQIAGTWPRAWLDSDTVQPPVAANEPIEWMPVWSLTEGRTKYAPADCLFWETDPAHARAGLGCVNGTGAGLNLDAAFLHAFFELCERDAAAIWWYNRIQRPAVDLEAFGSDFIRTSQEDHRRLGRTIRAIDLTHDLGIPTFAAISATDDEPPSEITLGFGCRLDPKSALEKAVAEMNQFITFPMRFSDGPGSQPIYRETKSQIALQWFAHENLDTQPWLKPSPEAPRTPTDFTQWPGEDLRRDVTTCFDLATQHSIELLVLDRSRPDIELSVLKLIAPGMRPWWPRFAPGRLYDVPVKLGWLDRPTQETQLNPIPMFL